MAGLDTLGASRVLRNLRDRNLLLLHGVAAGSYYELPDRFGAHTAPPQTNVKALDGGESPSNGGEFGLDEQAALTAQRRLVESLGKKPRKDKLRAAILSLLSDRWWTPRELAQLLGREQSSLVEDHLGPMTQQGKLRRLYAEANHPEQAYQVAQGSLFGKNLGDDS